MVLQRTAWHSHEKHDNCNSSFISSALLVFNKDFKRSTTIWYGISDAPTKNLCFLVEVPYMDSWRFIVYQGNLMADMGKHVQYMILLAFISLCGEGVISLPVDGQISLYII